jgi:hypothetical protein
MFQRTPNLQHIPMAHTHNSHQIYNISQWHAHTIHLKVGLSNYGIARSKCTWCIFDLYLVELGRLWLQSLPRSFCHNHYASVPITTKYYMDGLFKETVKHWYYLLYASSRHKIVKLFVPWSVGYLSWKLVKFVKTSRNKSSGHLARLPPILIVLQN